MKPWINRLHRAVWIGIALLLASGPVAAAQDAGNGGEAVCTVRAAGSNVNVRGEPRIANGNVIGALRQGQSLPVIGRDAEAIWYEVAYVDATGYEVPQAWVAAQVVQLEGSCDAVPVAVAPPESPEMLALKAIPVLPTLDVPRLRAIYERGQTLGKNAHAFTKVGDCNTDTQYYLMAFDWDDYDLGPYAELEPTVGYFAGWFEHISLAGQVGYNSTTLLDPLFVNPRICQAGQEGTLACEYRREQPAVALMMFGPNDMLNLSEEQFRDAVTEIVEMSIDEGVIPVLTTFTWHQDWLWEKMLRFNTITVEIAQEYDVPLINFWRAALDLPGLGLVTNYTHLTESGFSGEQTYRIAFDGHEKTSGHALRNLLMLQTLDLLRREVLEVE